VSEKLLTLRELRIALVGAGCPFSTPPAPSTIRGWHAKGLKFHILPGGSRKLYRLSEVLAFLREHTEVVG
jgi:hypothetical protein